MAPRGWRRPSSSWSIAARPAQFAARPIVASKCRSAAIAPALALERRADSKSAATETARSEARQGRGGISPPALCRHDARRRPADRLRLSGTRGARRRHWHDVVDRGACGADVPCPSPIAGGEDPAVSGDASARCRAGRREAQPKPPVVAALPASLSRPRRRRAALPRPLAPSGASAIAIEREQDAAEPAARRHCWRWSGSDDRRARASGAASSMHRLLQICRIRRARRTAPQAAGLSAARVAHRLGRGDWSPDRRPGARHPRRPGLRAAVRAGQPRRGAGHGDADARRRAIAPFPAAIDRLAVTADRVLMVDYKTNRLPAATARDVPAAYLRQLALYRALLRRSIPAGRSRRAALHRRRRG